jgi:hypothetical protein
MKLTNSLFIALLTLGVQALSSVAEPQKTAPEARRLDPSAEGITLTMTTDKDVYVVGEKVIVHTIETNQSPWALWMSYGCTWDPWKAPILVVNSDGVQPPYVPSVQEILAKEKVYVANKKAHPELYERGGSCRGGTGHPGPGSKLDINVTDTYTLEPGTYRITYEVNEAAFDEEAHVAKGAVKLSASTVITVK